jgi:hypothetical protein
MAQLPQDTKFTTGLDHVLSSQGAHVIRTPFRAPKANAFAERWVRTVRNDCLDHTLIWGRRHLDHVSFPAVRAAASKTNSAENAQ